MGLTVATEGQGPLPIDEEALEGKASGSQVTVAHITALKPQLKRDRLIRINDRGGQSAPMIPHSRAHGCATIASITWTEGLETRVRAALAAGIAFNPLASGPLSQQQKDPSPRDGDGAFELPSQGY